MSFRISVRTGNANETVPTVRPFGKASRTCARVARQSKDCLRARSLRAGRLRKQCARLRGLFSPHLHGAFDCECAARSAIVRNIRHKPPHCIAQYASGLRTEYRPSAIGALRVALRRPAVCGGLGPARGFSPSPRYRSPKRPFCAMSCDIACKGATRPKARGGFERVSARTALPAQGRKTAVLRRKPHPETHFSRYPCGCGAFPHSKNG